MKTFTTVALTVLILFSAGCDEFKYTPTAVGRDGSVAVVADTLFWASPVGQALRDEIGQTIATLPAPEPAFRIETFPLISQTSLSLIQSQKNIVIAGTLDDSTEVGRLIRSLFSEDALAAVYANGGATVLRDDLWRLNQKVAIIAAPTSDELINIIHQSGEQVRTGFNEITRKRSATDMFRKGRQFDIETRLLDSHGFAVNVQHDFFVAIDTTDFVWLRRSLSSESWRSIFVHYIEGGNPAELSPEWIYDVRDSLTQRYIHGNLNGFVEIDRNRPLITENISFLDNFGYETRGLWQMMDVVNGEKIQAGMGGPFISYTFYDQKSGRIYLIDGMVFAPGYAKREFLRQVEVISYTFRSALDEPVVTDAQRKKGEELLNAPLRFAATKQ